jgi:hypothetical protein
MRWLCLLLLIATPGCVGCAFSFDDPSRVVDRRVLGVRTEPPELTLPPSFPFSITASALVVEPFAADPTVPFAWRACAIDGLPPGTGGVAAGGFGGTSAKLCPEDDTWPRRWRRPHRTCWSR